MFEAGMIDLYDNIERRLGKAAWVLPFAVAAGSFLVSKALLHKSTTKSLVSAGVSGMTAAGLVGKGKAMKANA